MSTDESKIYKNYLESPLRSVKYDSYFTAYEKVLNKFIGKKITLVEIGVHNGGSLYMWKNYLGENARIIGIDLNPAAKQFEKDGFEIFIGDQGDIQFWKDFFNKIGKVDIVIDDGGHTYDQQILTLNSCIKNINSSGVLITEDVHTSYFKSFGYPSKYSFVNWSKKIIDNINSRSKNVKTNENIYTKSIESVEFFESIIVFNINHNIPIKSTDVSNNGVTANLEDYRYKSKFLNNITQKINNQENKESLKFKKTIFIKMKLRILSILREYILWFFNKLTLNKSKKLFNID